jgi:ribosome-binding protein aMBF1 (putative translation factor)
MRLQVYVREVNRYLIQLSKKKQVISIKRESTRGRSPTPLFFIAGATIPEEKKVKEERDERIRQAYFLKGWSIKRIKRELHHDKRTIRRALNPDEVIPWLSR